MLHYKNKNNKILLTKRPNINNRKIKSRKKFLQASIYSLILTLGIAAFSFIGIKKALELSQNEQKPSQTHLISQTVQAADYQSINYDRPNSVLPAINNAGGPFKRYDLSTESEAEESNMELQLRAILASGNPEFIPNIWSHLGKINNEFGFRRNPFGGRTYEFHSGMDIDGERGDTVLATANGTITKAGWQGGYGNLIEIDHGNGLTTRYGHLSRVGVQVGDTIQRGQIIGLLGSTGRSTGPHLHYELRLNDRAINPRRFLPPEPTRING